MKGGSLTANRIDVKKNLALLLDLDKRVWASNPPLLPLETEHKLLAFLTVDHHSETWLWKNSKGKFIAYISLIDKPHEEAMEVLRICVNPNLQRRGIGGEMMEFAEKMAIGLRRKRIYLATNKTNAHALSFYKKLGYKIVREVENYYGEGETRYICEKALRP